MMKHFSRNLISLLLIFLIAVPGTAFADAAAAQVFYENAAKEYGKGNYGQAAELLYKAYVNDANLIYAYNRILALQADKQYTAALKELNVFEDQMTKDPDKRFEDVPQIKTKLEDQVKAAASANVKDPVVKDPVVKDPVVKDPDVKEPDNVQPLPTSGLNSNEVLGVTLVGAGVLALAPGILFVSGILIEDQKSRVDTVAFLAETDSLSNAVARAYDDEDCGDTCSSQYNDEESEVTLHETLSFVLIGVGSALIIGGGVIYLISGDTPPADTDANASNFSFNPYLTPTSAGAGFTLDF